MNSNEKSIESVSPVRRRLLAGIGILSVFAFVAAAVRLPRQAKRVAVSCSPDEKPKTVRMLARDGTLVEVDASLLRSGGRKASDAELREWIEK